jgi:hypothetical protein
MKTYSKGAEIERLEKKIEVMQRMIDELVRERNLLDKQYIEAGNTIHMLTMVLQNKMTKRLVDKLHKDMVEMV